MNPPQFALSTSGPSSIGSQPPAFKSALAPAAVHQDSIDGWIDNLHSYTETVLPRQVTVGTTLEESLLRLEHGRDTPKIELLRFDGTPIEWPRFVERFYEHVHNKPFSTDTRRMTQLRMHLDGQARKLVEGLGCDGKGYAIALQTLKKRFGHRSLIAHSLMEEVTKGEVVPPNNRRSLSIFHTALRNCIFTLNRMNFTSGLNFTENLRMAISRLPPNMRRSWAKTSQYIRRTEEPTLVHFEHWLSAEVEAAHDPERPGHKEDRIRC